MSVASSIDSYQKRKNVSLKQKLTNSEIEIENLTIKLKTQEHENKKLHKLMQLNKKITTALVLEKEKLNNQAVAYKTAKKQVEYQINLFLNKYTQVSEYLIQFNDFWVNYLSDGYFRVDVPEPRLDIHKTAEYIDAIRRDVGTCVNCGITETTYQEKLESYYDKVRVLENEVLFWKTKFENAEFNTFQNFTHNSFNDRWRHITENDSSKHNCDEERNRKELNIKKINPKVHITIDESFEEPSIDSTPYKDISRTGGANKKKPMEVGSDMIFESLHNEINVAFDRIKNKIV